MNVVTVSARRRAGRGPTAHITALLLVAALAAAAAAGAGADPRADSAAPPPAPGRFAGTGIVVGLEYAVLDNPRLVRSMARTFAETGLTGMKHYAEAVEWGAMQKAADAPIDFSRLDLFVREYQEAGFTELTLCLRPYCSWGSKSTGLLNPRKNHAPKPEHRQRFADWIRATVERYDGDGRDDMPGLRWPARYLEIGNEFSSYQPEPVAEYLETLALAYRAAHEAYPDVRVGHVAFLITPVDLDVRDPAEVDAAWARTKLPDQHHGLADQRIVLDHPECFDVLNIHNLGSPYETEHILRWLDFETRKRGYTRPVIISDTTPTFYIGWGPATIVKGPRLGSMVPPAVEADRPRLAAFFSRLVGGDAATLAWTRGFVAADQVQRTIVAAAQGVKLINLSFTTDLPFLTAPALQAGAGIAAWGGAIKTELFTGVVREKYPLFFALRQLMARLDGCEAVERVPVGNDRARVYALRKGGGAVEWVGWLDPGRAIIPEDGEPTLAVALPLGAGAGGSGSVVLEDVITELGQTAAATRRLPVTGGSVTLTLRHRPVYVRP